MARTTYSNFIPQKLAGDFEVATIDETTTTVFFNKTVTRTIVKPLNDHRWYFVDTGEPLYYADTDRLALIYNAKKALEQSNR